MKHFKLYNQNRIFMIKRHKYSFNKNSESNYSRKNKLID